VGGGVEIGAYTPGEEAAVEADAYDLSAEPSEDRVVLFEPGMTMEDIEREAISAALAEVRGNRRRAADMLGIGERTLYRKIAKYDLDG
jgi:DNA-binding NtrC family response regulator